ncbi:MAG: hypothetical protein ACOCQ2_00715 [Halanaerobiales bacterium]
MTDKVFYKLENFFTTNSIYFTYYDLYFKNNEILLAYLEESHRSFLVRNPRVGEIKREKLQNLSYNKIKNYCSKNIIITLDQINKIYFRKANFFKNLKLSIETEENHIKLFNSKNNIDVNQIKKSLQKRDYPVSTN